MKFTAIAATILSGNLLLALPANAQTAADYHPNLSDTFDLSIGGYWPDKTMTVGVDGSHPEEEIDFDEALKLDDTAATGALSFRWKFGEKWSVWGQYWSVDDDGGANLVEDLEWEDVVLREGTFASGGFETRVARVFFGRKFVDRPNQEAGIGAGFHWLELEAFLEGQILTSEGDTEFFRDSVDAGFPLPNIGGWYHFSWHPKWMVGGRVDWLSASIGDYSGGLWNANVGINWAAFRHFGIGLYYSYFRLDVDIDKSDWRGAAEAKQNGPMLSVNFTW